MPVLDISDPNVSNFLSEIYDKEKCIRSNWMQLNGHKFERFARKIDLKHYSRTDIIRAVLTIEIMVTAKSNIEAARHRNKAPLPSYTLYNIKGNGNDIPPMLPIEAKAKEVLKECRSTYLKMRSEQIPKERYHFIESENWKYGWKLNESMLTMRGPLHGRVSHLIKGICSHVGSQHDPDYYATCPLF